MAQLLSHTSTHTQLADSPSPPVPPPDPDRLSVLLLLARGDRLAQAAAANHLFEADTLPQALDLWQTAPPDWAVVDLAWAEGGGLAFLAALGDICAQRPLPVVVLVGPGQERMALEAMKLGAADYLFKGEFAPDDLWAKLRPLPHRAQPTALEQAHQHYQNLVENSPDIVERFDRHLRHLYVSPSLARLTGVDTAAFLGKTCRELNLDSGMVATWEAAAAALLATGEKQTIEFTTPTLIGVRHFEMAIAPEWSATGEEIESILCISRDISDRVMAQQVQQRLLTEAQAAQRDATAARDLLTRVFDRINDGIIAFDCNACCVYLNPSAERILQRSAADLIGHNVWAKFPEAVDTSIYEAYHRAVEQQQPEALEYYFPPLNTWFEMRLYPNADGVTAYFTDISDRKVAAASRQQAQHLRRELSLLETTLDSILAGYWDIDCEANTAYMSPGLKAMFGYADHELPNHPNTWQTLIHPDDLPIALANLERHIQSHGQVPYYTEVRYRHKNGSTVWIICAGQVIAWDAAGQPRRIVGCHVNITRLKHTEAQLRKNEAHLQAAQRIGNLGSWEFELATERITWSEQVYRIFGLAVGEQLTSCEALQDYFHPDDQARHHQTIETAMATHQPFDEEFRILRADGSPGHIHIKGEAVVNELGQLTHLTGTVQDISERKQHDAEVQNLSLRLSLALESGRIGTWSWDLQQAVLWDQRMYEIWGLESLGRAVIFDDWIARVHPDDLPTVEAAIHQALQGNGHLDIEFRFYRPNAELRWIRAAAIVQESPAGAAQAMVGINYDITKHKQAAIELERLSLRLSLALESGRIGSWERILSTDEVTWDQCLVDLYGFARLGHQATYQDWRAQVYADDLAWVEAANQALLDSNTPYDVEFRVWRGDGSLGWIRSSALVQRDAHAQPVSIIGINYDITDQKQAAAELQNLSARLALALESGGFGCWEWDVATNAINWDQRLIELYGFEEGRPNTYQDWCSRVYNDDLQAVEAALQAALATDAPYDSEFRIYRSDGELRWIKASALVYRTPEGQPLSMVGINYDITEKKRAELQILRTTAQLEASNRELEAFAYSVSHDLRAPLRAIDGFSRALLEDYGDQFDQEGQDYFDRIRHNVGRMGQLIDDLLRLSRVSRQAMTYETVNLSTLVQEQIDALRSADPDRSVTVTIAPSIAVSADPTLMQVAIANLVQNAWKFTSHRPSACLDFGVVVQGGEPVYYLRDNGAGFDMAYADKLFGVFQRLHNTHEFPGTGIGLATVQRAIHRQGGRVWAKAAVDQGAVFYFTLPRASGAEGPP
ncbi:PAS domain-containing protein [Nodosilinea sp. LEGE 06152]|uniref:PAS domain-containing protein n=1 Tax=Nodosilinea sp. LEGE 06152 TaxID=2777966 RepID=UPI00187F090D|nr:PAS domain-containing protein [Nodosilinea sp. LEGE 06152]MBE9159505.1 PAS domain-containing protein [Nodosilinea sp. LEGE 06152]